jgi:hypothetical protein
LWLANTFFERLRSGDELLATSRRRLELVSVIVIAVRTTGALEIFIMAFRAAAAIMTSLRPSTTWCVD